MGDPGNKVGSYSPHPSPLKIPIMFSGVGMDIFCNDKILKRVTSIPME